jgi:hypothetical protein
MECEERMTGFAVKRVDQCRYLHDCTCTLLDSLLFNGVVVTLICPITVTPLEERISHVSLLINRLGLLASGFATCTCLFVSVLGSQIWQQESSASLCSIPKGLPSFCVVTSDTYVHRKRS